MRPCALVAQYLLIWPNIHNAGCSGKNGNGRKRPVISDEEDQKSAPLPEPTDFELLEVRLGANFVLPSQHCYVIWQAGDSRVLAQLLALI
eukprot:COSAG02_NODE_427_length_22498_cov_11.745212_7_plen_90_part_00